MPWAGKEACKLGRGATGRRPIRKGPTPLRRFRSLALCAALSVNRLKWERTGLSGKGRAVACSKSSIRKSSAVPSATGCTGSCADLIAPTRCSAAALHIAALHVARLMLQRCGGACRVVYVAASNPVRTDAPARTHISHRTAPHRRVLLTSLCRRLRCMLHAACRMPRECCNTAHHGATCTRLEIEEQVFVLGGRARRRERIEHRRKLVRKLRTASLRTAHTALHCTALHGKARRCMPQPHTVCSGTQSVERQRAPVEIAALGRAVIQKQTPTYADRTKRATDRQIDRPARRGTA